MTCDHCGETVSGIPLCQCCGKEYDPDIDRVGRERDAAREYMQRLEEATEHLTRERDAARAHFRRACELLAQAGANSGIVSKKAAVWQKEIEENG